MKKLIYECYDAVFFGVDLLNIDIDFDWETQLDELLYLPHPTFTFDNYIDARLVASQMVKYIPEYNYAIVTLQHYTQTEKLDSEGEPVRDCINFDIVAEFASKDFKEDNGDK